MHYIFSLHANFIGTSQCTSNLSKLVLFPVQEDHVTSFIGTSQFTGNLSKLVLFPVQDDHVTNFIGPVNVQSAHRIVSM